MPTDVMDDVVLKDLIEATQNLINAKNAGTSDKDLQHDLHVLFERFATDIDVSALTNGDSRSFRDAVSALREHTFVAWNNSIEWTQASIRAAQSMADAFKWPPVLPQVAIVCNLVKALLSHRIGVDQKFNHAAQKFDFSGYCDGKIKYRNGWTAFYLVYGDVIRGV